MLKAALNRLLQRPNSTSAWPVNGHLPLNLIPTKRFTVEIRVKDNQTQRVYQAAFESATCSITRGPMIRYGTRDNYEVGQEWQLTIGNADLKGGEYIA